MGESTSGAVATANPPTVAILSTAHGEGSGAEAVLEHLLRGWDSARLRLGVLAPPDSRVGRVALETGQLLAPLATHRDTLPANVVATLRTMRQVERPAVVHAWHGRGYELAALSSAMLRVPYALTVHDHPRCSAHGAGRRFLIGRTLSRARRAAFVSEATRDAWTARQRFGDHDVIRNGLVDTCRSSRGTGGPLRVGFLGMNAGWKGFEIVANWIAATINESVSWQLYGELAPEYQQRLEAARRSGARRVSYSGRKSTREIFEEIDVLVHASTSFDPLPTVLIEAARAGIPSIASTRGGAGEIVRDGVTGLTFDPADPSAGLRCLRSLIADRARVEGLGLSARRVYEQRFRVGAMVDAYEEFWRCTISPSERRCAA